MNLVFTSTPMGSLLPLPFDKRESYLSTLFSLPKNVQSMSTAEKTGAYIRGLTKTNNLVLEKAPQIAFAVLRVAVGEVPLAKLAAVLSTELQLANDQAQRLATEIERDLFAPVALEMGQFLQTREAEKRSSASTAATSAGARNVLNLKTTAPKPPRPPAIPRSR